jgi:hypothetical protein
MSRRRASWDVVLRGRSITATRRDPARTGNVPDVGPRAVTLRSHDGPAEYGELIPKRKSGYFALITTPLGDAFGAERSEGGPRSWVTWSLQYRPPSVIDTRQ